jgi:hypothetical protein
MISHDTGDQLATMLTTWAEDQELNPSELVGTLVAIIEVMVRETCGPDEAEIQDTIGRRGLRAEVVFGTAEAGVRMSTVRELSVTIAKMQARHRHALEADMAALKVRYGGPAIAEATQLLRQQEMYRGLSASADRHRRHAARQADAEAQMLFAKRKDR